MVQEQYYEIALHLNNIHDLFTTPVVDPFSEKARFVSGIDFIKSELKSRPLRLGTGTRVTIFLPRESVEPGLVAKTKDALKRYCQFKIRQNKLIMAESLRTALKTLLIGILFLVSGLFLSEFLGRVLILPGFSGFFSTLFGDGFDIAFWVILWRPVDFFLFELWPFLREDYIYKYMMNMEIIMAEER